MEGSDPVEGKEEEGLAVVSLDRIQCRLQGEEDMEVVGVDMEDMVGIDDDDDDNSKNHFFHWIQYIDLCSLGALKIIITSI